jgi:hypothetical protein
MGALPMAQPITSVMKTPSIAPSWSRETSLAQCCSVTAGYLMMICVIALCITARAHAADDTNADNWRFKSIKGEVTLEANGHKKAVLEVTQAIPPGATVSTGAAGSAVLVRGKDTMSMLPNSRVLLDRSGSSSTTIFQELGDVLFEIGKQSHPHFQVDTRYLAAVVKGTTFGVRIDDKSARVSVAEGAVEVATGGRESVVLTLAGQTARVLGDLPAQIDLLKGNALMRTVIGAETSGGGWSGLRPGLEPDQTSDGAVAGKREANTQAQAQASDPLTDKLSATEGLGDKLGQLEGLRKQLSGIADVPATTVRTNRLPVTRSRSNGLSGFFEDRAYLYPVAALAVWLLFLLIRSQVRLMRRVRNGGRLDE